MLLLTHMQVVVGDDTWAQLKPKDVQYTAVHPYPSFNVRDLHTVDDGVIHVSHGAVCYQEAAPPL